MDRSPVLAAGALALPAVPAVSLPAGRAHQSAPLAAQGALAVSFRASQALLALLLVRQVTALWGLLNLQDVMSSWPPLAGALETLIAQQAAVSAQAGTAYYLQARAAAGAGLPPAPSPVLPLGGMPEPVLPELPAPVPELPPVAPPDPQVIRITLEITGPRSMLRRVREGQQVQEAARNAGVVMAGAATRLVLNGARQAVLQAVQADARAVGWMRVTAADPCSWCAMLASRGPVYRSEQSAGFKAHAACVPAGTLTQGPSVEAGYRRWYEGELIIIGTASGKDLAITPNHPVLTPQGWVPAGLLREGQDVLGSLHGEWRAADSPDEHDGPSAVEDIWRALSVTGLVGMPVTAEDFHGDWSDGEVDVVFPHGLLADYVGSAAGEPSIQRRLVAALSRGPGTFAACGAALGVLGGYADPPRGLVGAPGQSAPLLGTHGRHADVHGLAAAAGLNAMPEQHWPYGGARDLVALCESLLGGALFVEGGDLVLGQGDLVAARGDAPLLQLADQRGGADVVFGAGVMTTHPGHVGGNGAVHCPGREPVAPRRFDPGILDGPVDASDAYISLGADLRKRLSGCVEPDRIVELRRREFRGHVFNLQTAEGWYEASGVIVSNCRCIAQPVFSHSDARALRDSDLYRQWLQATRGYSGQDAVNAWRRYWQKAHPTAPGIRAA